jgi:hypothetical protein
LIGGYKRIIAHKPRLWKAANFVNFANDTNGAVPCRCTV